LFVAFCAGAMVLINGFAGKEEGEVTQYLHEIMQEVDHRIGLGLEEE